LKHPSISTSIKQVFVGAGDGAEVGDDVSGGGVGATTGGGVGGTTGGGVGGTTGGGVGGTTGGLRERSREQGSEITHDKVTPINKLPEHTVLEVHWEGESSQ
jgi:hypothetical protein